MASRSASEPTVSVVIPAYNAAAFLPRAVESVLGQTYSDFELIVVDDGSTDETPQVMEKYEGGDVRYLRKENGGAASARNRGIREARGTHIAPLDADDAWLSEKLERQMALHRQNSDLMWSFTNWIQVDQSTGKTVCRADQIMDNQGGDVLRPLIGRLFIPPSTEIFRMEVFEEVGFYDESEIYRFGEDWEFSLRVAECYPVGYIEEPVVQRFLHDEKTTSTMDLDRALRDRRAIIEETMQRNSDRLRDIYAPVIANLYTNIGRKWLDREKRGRALQMFGTAIRKCPSYWRAWTYGAAALLPRTILRVLGRLRTATRRFARRIANSPEPSSEGENTRSY